MKKIMFFFFLILMILFFSGCNKQADPSDAGNAADGNTTWTESPALHSQVEAGSLPPLEQRLPDNPMVITPLEAVGEYTEILKSIQLRGDVFYSSRIIYETGLFVWSPDATQLMGNLAESWQVSEDVKSFTFYLRKGMKWSDGKPFTTSDIEFAIKDIIQNDILKIGFPAPSAGFANVEFIKTDEYTFTLNFEKPDGNLLTRLTNMGGKSIVMYQKEFSSRFHPKYNPNAEDEAKAKGFNSVVEYFYANCPHYFGSLDRNPERPTLNAWVISKGITSSSQLWEYERNPYYFKLDTEGKQLPYADKMVFYIVDSQEDRLLRSLSGEVDYVYTFSPLDRPLLYENREKGQFDVIDVPFDGGPQLVIGFNRTGPDAELAELAADKRFRIAVSVAINREEICQALYNGLCDPFQAAPLKDTPFYDEEFAKQYTEYDPDMANQLLDELGLDKKNSDNIRLLKSGKPLTYTLAYFARIDTDSDILEFVQRYWREVGIKLALKAIDENSFMELMNSGQYNISAMTGPNNLYTFNPWAMVPSDRTGAIYASGWYGYLQHRIDNSDIPFVEPDDKTKEAIEAYLAMSATVDQDRKVEYANKIIANAKEQFYLIGTITTKGQSGLVNQNMVNLDSFVLSWQRGAPSNIQPCQWWKKKS